MKRNKKIALLMVIMTFLLTMLSGCGFSFSSAKVTKATACASVDEGAKPINAKSTFSTSDKIIYVSALVKNAPSDTKVNIIWYYYEDGQKKKVDSVPLTLDTSRYIASNLSVKSGFPKGKYEVDFYVNDREKPDTTVNINVE